MKKSKRVLLYSPYLDTFGGGERHYLSIIKVLDSMGYATDIAWDNPTILSDIEKHLQINFTNARQIPNFFKHANSITKILKTFSYHIVLYVTDGSYFFSLGKKNYIFAMVPQRSLYQKTILNKLKMINQKFISNSQFTQKNLIKWSVESEVLYPYIDKDFFLKDIRTKKEPIVLSVGRFFSYLHSKKQEEIISTFIKIKQKNILFEKYKLFLVGRLKNEDKMYFTKIKKMIGRRNDIKLLINLEQDKLIDLYKKSDLYWHFTGYGEDQAKKPYAMEHLGISPLEAMAAGCVVFAYNGGGIGEIIEDGKTGCLFKNNKELIGRVEKTIEANNLTEMREQAQDYVHAQFSYSRFSNRVAEILAL